MFTVYKYDRNGLDPSMLTDIAGCWNDIYLSMFTAGMTNYSRNGLL